MRPHDSETAPFGRRHPAHILVVEMHRAGAGRMRAGQHAHKRRFAGTVRPHHAHRLARFKREVHVLQHRQRAEALGDASGVQQGAWT